MRNVIIIKGRLTSPKSVELFEEVAGVAADVEVTVRPTEEKGGSARSPAPETIVDFLRGLPVGTRGKDEIDGQVAAERDAWGDGR